MLTSVWWIYNGTLTLNTDPVSVELVNSIMPFSRSTSLFLTYGGQSHVSDRWRDKTYWKYWLDVPRQSLARCPPPKWKQKNVLPLDWCKCCAMGFSSAHLRLLKLNLTIRVNLQKSKSCFQTRKKSRACLHASRRLAPVGDSYFKKPCCKT